MKTFCIRENIFPIGEIIYCSCHATWLPGKPQNLNDACVNRSIFVFFKEIQIYLLEIRKIKHGQERAIKVYEFKKKTLALSAFRS